MRRTHEAAKPVLTSKAGRKGTGQAERQRGSEGQRGGVEVGGGV